MRTYKAKCEKCEMECEVKSSKKIKYFLNCLCGDRLILEEEVWEEPKDSDTFVNQTRTSDS